jgi:Flp pilus assembly secretin CpaC
MSPLGWLARIGSGNPYGVCLSLFLLLIDAGSGHGQVPDYAQASPPEAPRISQPEIQLDVIMMEMRHDVARNLFPPLLKSSRQTISYRTDPAWFGVVKSSRELGVFLEVLKEEGLLKLLAEPRLVTRNGQPASFDLGWQQAVDVPSDKDRTAVSFARVDGSSQVVPTLLPKDRIRLELVGKMPQPASSDAERLHASAELKEGQTFVIGALAGHQETETVTSIPLLGQLPIVGSAFRVRKLEQREEELVVLVTPWVVGPESSDSQPNQSASKHLEGAIESRLRRVQRRLNRIQEEVEDLQGRQRETK